MQYVQYIILESEGLQIKTGAFEPLQFEEKVE